MQKKISTIQSILLRYFLVLTSVSILGFTANSQDKFLWATASAAYQVEGGYKADGKGLSNWDVYTNDYKITAHPMFAGEVHTGNVAINEYDRKQYLQDIALMKKLGVNSYRFSIAWTRIIPNGIGKVNEKGIQHYLTFINDLLANGIEPMVTLYHWDMPQALEDKGGWLNPESVNWYDAYAKIIFKTYGDKVKKFITFNEPYINNFLIEPVVKNIIKKEHPFNFTSESLSKNVVAVHHLLLANAKAIQQYHSMKLNGKIGITLSLSPSIAANTNSEADNKAAIIQDGLHNRWFLEPLYNGKYPTDILALYQEHLPTFKPTIDDYKLFAANKPDFIGVNYYAPAYVKSEEKMAFGVNWMINPDTVKAFNGPVRPEYLYQLLMRLKADYGNPTMIITENGAGFGPNDEKIVDDKINDSLRTNYIITHIEAALKAKKEGANLQGYTVWSLFDNFEWMSGYKSRFGMVNVNFKTQKRIPKRSFFEYQKIIKAYK